MGWILPSNGKFSEMVTDAGTKHGSNNEHHNVREEIRRRMIRIDAMIVM